ncbi:41557_t:CDS:2 [Gigaspora margarita]|uniref:41557_t:CDS:1 n=1 Tax=Gigaspora margarita TaxID=4874 RepID=A0ABN7UGW8_GIGMA|nr:41557_t:CDS:2 [Gigaspora margarita]
MALSEVSFSQEVEESEPNNLPSVSFEEWITAIRKVWDQHSQEDRNLMTAANLEAIVNAGIKRKSNIALYGDYAIPNPDLEGTIILLKGN